MLALMRVSDRWPDLLVVCPEGDGDIELRARPADLARPKQGHVWMTTDAIPEAYQYDVRAAMRALGSR